VHATAQCSMYCSTTCSSLIAQKVLPVWHSVYSAQYTHNMSTHCCNCTGHYYYADFKLVDFISSELALAHLQHYELRHNRQRLQVDGEVPEQLYKVKALH
jgi:hypothetical protein